ncbi:hypothetical protein PENSOL_c001G05164 [Penicillium solitum]|uniref:Dihydroxy-acid/6-phosphogluconate dehydratase C-terminal domain-containing protein n=1 Tax=Penicillium solitum TaxID=60172 RepID=A0A1V6RQF1_9EURO|nr:uncharacterized protein PENSOL_c001G05164 [Penicillium solitum]OQE03808.1 hypothetical protein PENSOL_c001G05164 [Penicillium solitum]
MRDITSLPAQIPKTLIVRSADPLGYLGAAEVGNNMHSPGQLPRQKITLLPYIGNSHQSGTSSSLSIPNASPEGVDVGNLAFLRGGDRLRVDLNKRDENCLVRSEPKAVTRDLGEIHQLNEGIVLRDGVKYRVAQRVEPRHSHRSSYWLVVVVVA